MSRYRSDPEMLEYDKPSVCTSFLHYTWKTITCLLSHITLVSMVVSYCVLGAFTFEYLEVHHEKDVKRNISKLRYNVSQHLWNLTKNKLEYFKDDEFKNCALVYLKEFESAILKAMTKDGWDGEEDPEIVQWTSTGALFYSIIVITTIGYGHISPKTHWGKIVTIFYAILGIPLMLLCLSNIGDIMATSFRFLYWRVCCYMCTKKPKRKRSKRSNSRMTSEFSRSRNASFKRSMRTSTRSADSGFGRSEIGHYSHSDTELRYHEEVRDHRAPRGSSLPRMRPSQTSRFSDATTAPLHKSPSTIRPPSKGGSLDRRKHQKNMEVYELDPVILAKTPILCNRYVLEENDMMTNNLPNAQTSPPNRRAKSLPRNQQYLELPRMPSPTASSSDGSGRRSPRSRRKRSPPRHNPSPKMMTPLGYGHRSKYLDDPDSEEEFYEEDDDYYENVRTRIKPVPIWLCVLLVVSYIVAGAFLFTSWEGWLLLDAAYFCFITLTTIGFGDLVPAKGVNQNDGNRATVSIALCSLYLLFGIALLAMSFNLVQEEVIGKVKNVAKTLGIIKKDDEDSEDDV